jgi:hypothetical protein
MIIVLRSRGQLHWYCSSHQDWVLDQEKQALAWHRPPPSFSARYGIGVLDESSIDQFIRLHARFECTPPLLTTWVAAQPFPPNGTDSWAYIYPSMLIDFDLRRLKVFQMVPMAYREFLPEGWTDSAALLNDAVEIPVTDRYWLVEGKDRLDDWMMDQIEASTPARSSIRMPAYLEEMDSYLDQAQWVKKLTGYPFENLELVCLKAPETPENHCLHLTYGPRGKCFHGFYDDWMVESYIVRCLQDLGAPSCQQLLGKRAAWWIRLWNFIKSRG